MTPTCTLLAASANTASSSHVFRLVGRAPTLPPQKFARIRFVLMVGIGGGVPSAELDIRLGDVVISQPHMQHGGVIQYDFGKTGPSGFIRTGSLNTPPTILLNALSKLRANHVIGRNSILTHLSAVNLLPEFAYNNAGPDILFESAYKHVEGPTCARCSKDRLVERNQRRSQEIVVHYGTIASGNQVIKDGLTRDRLSSELGGVLCFKMEAAGLMNSFPCLVIRGICDYADSHKNKRWQPYAAAAAAKLAEAKERKRQAKTKRKGKAKSMSTSQLIEEFNLES
jgi:nucleoside phosphorylase